MQWSKFPSEIELWPLPEIGSGTFATSAYRELLIAEEPVVLRVQAFNPDTSSDNSLFHLEFETFTIMFGNNHGVPTLTIGNKNIIIFRSRLSPQVSNEQNYLVVITNSTLRVRTLSDRQASATTNLLLPRLAQKVRIRIEDSNSDSGSPLSLRIRFGHNLSSSDLLGIEDNFMTKTPTIYRLVLSTLLLLFASVFIFAAQGTQFKFRFDCGN